MLLNLLQSIYRGGMVPYRDYWFYCSIELLDANSFLINNFLYVFYLYLERLPLTFPYFALLYDRTTKKYSPILSIYSLCEQDWRYDCLFIWTKRELFYMNTWRTYHVKHQLSFTSHHILISALSLFSFCFFFFNWIKFKCIFVIPF